MTWLLIKLLIRIAVFTGVFALAVWKSPQIRIERRWAIVLVGLVFGVLNTGLYWLLAPVLKLATFGIAWLFAPLVLNGLFLWATGWLLKKIRIKSLEIEGWWILVKLALLLSLIHGALYLALDVFIK